MHNGGIKSFNFHSSPRMVPHTCKPEVRFVEFSIEKFVPYGKKSKNAAMDQSTFSRNLTNDEQKCIDKYFHSSSDVSWIPSLIAFPSFQALPSLVSTVRHSFRTKMFVDAMQRLQAVSPSMVKAEIASRPYNECGTSQDKIGQGSAFHLSIDGASDSSFQVSSDQILEFNPSLHRQHNDVPKPKPHCFLFSEGSTTINSFGSVSISYVPVLQHKGHKGREVVSQAYNVLATAGPIHVYTSGFSPKASSKLTMKMKDAISEASGALKPVDNIGCPQSNVCAYAVKNVLENGKHASQTNSDKLNQKVLEYSTKEINDDMQCFPASPVDKSSNTEIEIELNSRVTHLIEHGIVPETPMLNTDNYSPLDEKKAFSSFSWFGEKDGRALSQMHVNKLSVDESRSQPDVLGVNACKSNLRRQIDTSLNVLYEKGMETLKSTIDEGKNDQIARIEHETDLTPLAKASSQTSGVDWKPNSGGASNSVFQVTKYKRLCKYVNEVGKLPASFAEGRIELIETAFASTMSIQDTKKRRKDGRNEKAMQDVDAFFEEEAEVSEDAPFSEDEVIDEKSDQYDDSFIDDRPNLTEVSTTAESSGNDMMAFYRRSLLSQSPIVVPGKLTATSHESFSSEAAESCSPGKEKNNTVNPQDGSCSISRLDGSNSLIGYRRSGNTALSVEPDNYKERCSARIESRKRKLIFRLPPADTIEENSQPRCETQKANVEHASPNRQLGLSKLDTNHSCDDDFYQSLDLDEVEAQAAKLLRYRSESLMSKSQATAQTDGASPSFDLGI
ncbi:hypothetical protein HPP92_004438 [Vanilla planifolia]|uniref:Uncharacterized protein n=1 Tax=Vanilla planifolia TaxID=51239 RepID=A0A835VI44_VANPL|nr:hypothetical protein HPP92_004438 [Vanilla planifolia]